MKIHPYMDTKGIDDLNAIRGKALNLLSEKTNLEPFYPKVNSDRCVLCGKCQKVCLKDAITKQNTLHISKEKCVGCGHCISICPFNALT